MFLRWHFDAFYEKINHRYSAKKNADNKLNILKYITTITSGLKFKKNSGAILLLLKQIWVLQVFLWLLQRLKSIV